MSNPIDGSTVVTTYFEDRIAEAQKDVEAAQAALDAARAKVGRREAERDEFTQTGSLHQPAYDSETGRPEWELCLWAQARIGDVAFKDMTPAGDTAYQRLRAEESAAHRWLRENGYTVPAPFDRTR
ncbi:hypothetical protein ACIGW7_39895 [Streptomyces sp. NPDC053253]|uniref:hypothetical protein n=1 Tax=Streptomyces sp. NPDC053253 TaxID=3365699 RepID=UPI0037D4ED8D